MDIGYKLLETPKKGEGIFATHNFEKNDVVMKGIIEIDNIEANHSHASQMGVSRFALHGGYITKVNHSCSPNCGIRLNDSGAHDFIAKQTITPGDEITFDYAMRNYKIEFFPKQCCCGSSKCRGSVTGWKDLSEQLKIEYKNYAAPYLLEIDKKAIEIA
jgi:hypothetical protein